jgi:hypothetical protein
MRLSVPDCGLFRNFRVIPIKNNIKREKMAGWAEYALELERLLCHTIDPIACKKFEKEAVMEKARQFRG